MKITYERDIDHCEVSPYVKEVTVGEIMPANNSDNLEVVKFQEIGWQVVAQKGLHEVGKRVTYLPPETVMPFELSEELGVTNYLSKGRVKAIKLRGNRSEGMIVDTDKVAPYISYMLQWNNPPSKSMGGQALAVQDTNPYFAVFYKMPNILNEPETFAKGETIWYSEKIHGTNFRMAWLPHPHTREWEFYVGSHNVVLKECDNVYWNVARRYKDIIPKGVVFYGEIYGSGIQKMNYGVNSSFPEMRIFSCSIGGEYLIAQAVKYICLANNIPAVEFNKIKFDSIDQLRELAEADSELTSNHMREGIVVVSDMWPEKMAKCVSFKYLEKYGRK